MRHTLALLGLIALTSGAAWSCAAGASDSECPIGSEKCPCTDGGSCDGSLVCLSDICVNPNPDQGGATNTGGTGPGSGGAGSGAFNPGSGGSVPCDAGCSKIDVLFALDGSGSMAEEIGALSASQSFATVIQNLAAVNCGNINYRIGVTDDNDGGFLVPSGWPGAHPWFDSTELTDDQIMQAFTGAANQVIAGSGTAVGCEHVLSSSVSLLTNDSTGFVRPDALLVLVMVTDVDDYGAYDNINGNSCGLGCNTVGQPVANLYQSLVTLKNNEPKGVATVVVGGDPAVQGGSNFCGQPGTCCSGGIDCQVFHADRLWSFAAAQTGTNGYTANLCAGPQTVPNAVQAAFADNIDLACQGFDPPQ